MQRYLSFGAGVNSTALMLWLLDHGVQFEAVYADHGTDWPETRDYVAMLQRAGYPVTVLQARRGGLNLYDYYYKHAMVLMRWVRACTVEYKLVPLAAYMATPCIVYLGISAEESHRIARIIAGQRPGEENRFPLADEGITRADCIEIIQSHGLPIPIKSGCYICPFQRKSQWVQLRTKHPDLFCKAKALEAVTNRRVTALGRPPICLAHDKPLDLVAMAGQMDLFGDRDFECPCSCEF